MYFFHFMFPLTLIKEIKCFSARHKLTQEVTLTILHIWPGKTLQAGALWLNNGGKEKQEESALSAVLSGYSCRLMPC